MRVAACAVNFLVESFCKKSAIIETREWIGDCVAVQTLQVVVFENDGDAEHSSRGQNIHKSGLKGNRRLANGGEVSPAEQHVIPEGYCLIFRDINVSER